MSTVITRLSFDLKFDAVTVPPHCSVGFTNLDEFGRETHGTVEFTDAAAGRIWEATKDALPAVVTELAVKAADVAEPGSVAARITAASEAERTVALKQAEIARLDALIAAKTAEAAPAEVPQ